MIRIRIRPIPRTTLAESKDEAADLRENQILPALEAGVLVELNFEDVGIATQSFMHALISEAIRRHGDRTFDLLTFKNCSDDVKQIVLTVFEYTILASEAAAMDQNGNSRQPPA